MSDPELMTGRNPFKKASPLATMTAITENAALPSDCLRPPPPS